ncbi:MAG: alanyl-tRNA editing protein, partial [Clostridium sp.]|nr:alanyl-tRNA editing protein [Clostridium sp.]
MQMKYYTDSTIFKFNTRVKTVEEKEDGVYVELEESYFYPESGDQLIDEGTINGKEVMDLMIIEGVLYHKLASFSGLTLNMQVNCIIDENVREAHTVTHTAQHVFSAVLKDGYNLNTIGFHMGKQITTIDLDGEISQDMLIEVEDRVNKIIRDDLKVKTYFRTLKEAQRLPLRKEMKDLENVRIVQIADIDYSGCGGTHVASLKEIQIFKVVDMEKYKGGLRISFAAGRKAFDYIKELEVTMRLLKEELNTSIDEMPYRVRRLKEEKAEEHLRAENHQKEMVNFMANSYDEDVIVEKTTYDEEMIKALGKEIMALDKMAVFYTEERKVYLFTGKKLHAKRVLDEAKAGLDFRGGAG